MARASRKQIVLKDPRAIRALSHPARIAVIDELYGGRVATSTELARLTGLTPSAMSWHLRAMQKLGLVERDDESAGDAREHPWRAAGSGVSVTGLQTRAQQAAGALLSGAVMNNLRHELDSYAANESRLPDEWRMQANFDTGTVYLTAEETRQLIEALNAASAPFRRRARRRKGTRRVRFAAAVIPATDTP